MNLGKNESKDICPFGVFYPNPSSNSQTGYFFIFEADFTPHILCAFHLLEQET